MRRLLAHATVIGAIVLIALPGNAFAHDEREATAPNHGGRVPQYRTSGPALVLGKSNLQIEGTGAKPDDVVIDAQFRRLNAIRADRADGVYLRNFMTQRTTFNGVYIMESDGFAIDRLTSRWNDEYGFLTFADDHGLYADCEAYGNGDSGGSTRVPRPT
jgi:hypothetical protein